jgi:5-methyltetrahydropteroyltriglutamate--homocysteine methyltransferase
MNILHNLAQLSKTSRRMIMQRSTERLLTTHTGSLPRPEGVPLPGTDAARQSATATDAQVRDAVRETVGRQVEAGLDVVNNGEMSKPSYSSEGAALASARLWK